MEAAPVGTGMVAQEVIPAEEIVIGMIGTVSLEEDMAKKDKEDSWIEEVEVTQEDSIIIEAVATLEDSTITEAVGEAEAMTDPRPLVTGAVRKVICHMIARMVVHKENHLIIDLSDQYQHKSIN